MIETTETQMVAEALSHPFIQQALSLVTGLPPDDIEVSVDDLAGYGKELAQAEQDNERLLAQREGIAVARNIYLMALREIGGPIAARAENEARIAHDESLQAPAESDSL